MFYATTVLLLPGFFAPQACPKLARTVTMTSVYTLSEERLRDAAEYWNSMCSAVELTDGTGLQPFTVPSGWMGSSSPPPVQAFTPEELAEETEGNAPVLLALIDAVLERAPSLCRRSSMLPLARLACWTDSKSWVRPLEEWPGEEKPSEATLAAQEVAEEAAAAADRAEIEAAAKEAAVATELADRASALADAANEEGKAEKDKAIQLGGKAARLRQEAMALRFTLSRVVREVQERAQARAEKVGKPLEAATLRSLSAHLLEQWDVPEALHGALTLADGPPVTEATHRVARAFLRVHAAAGGGEASVLAMLREQVSPVVSKAAAKHFVKLTARVGAGGDGLGGDDCEGEEPGGGTVPVLLHPLQALRRAQILSLGGEPWVADAACESRIGAAILPNENDADADADAGTTDGPTEAFALTCLDWIVRHQTELESPYTVTSIIDFFLEMRTIDPTYSCVGRTPKTVSTALEAYTASTVRFDDDEDE